MLRIIGIGGYDEVGRNMTLIVVDEEAIILDMGLYLPAVIDVEEQEDVKKLGPDHLRKIKAIPDDSIIEKYRDKIKAIVLGHCHLDHIGAVPYMAFRYSCPIIGTPYTMEVLDRMYRDDQIEKKNEFKVLNENSTVSITKNIQLEFVHTTHSTPQTENVALHTKYGTVLYTNDYKLDNYPVLGKEPNYERLKKLGQRGVKVLIIDSLYSKDNRKTPSEQVAKDMLKDVLLSLDNKNNLVVVTTFSSHIARLKSIIEIGKQMDRKIIFLGRSLFKYVDAAEKVGLVRFSDKIEMYGFSNQVKRVLEKVDKGNRKKYMLVCTGNQGEPNSILSRLVRKELPFSFHENDHVIFSSRTIPAPINEANRALIENRLHKQGVRVFKEIHTSGHASREDSRDLITLVKPDHIIPSHGSVNEVSGMADLAVDLGYVREKNVHFLHNGKILDIE